jgi:hypothetical protein
MKICPVGAELFHVGGWTNEWTDSKKLIVTFCNFVNVPKNSLYGYLNDPPLYKERTTLHLFNLTLSWKSRDRNTNFILTASATSQLNDTE